MSPSLTDFIDQLPKTENHLHIEGALPWELLCDANPHKYSTPPASWKSDFRFRDFAHFESELLGYAGDYFHSAQRYHDCAHAVFARSTASNVHYMEVSFASGCIDFMNLDGNEVADAIRAAVPKGLEVRIFLGIHHSGWTEKMTPILNDALGWQNLDGIDLHGSEDIPVDAAAPHYWKKARDAGKFTKAHAGEFMGADFVRYAVEVLGAQRINHGVRAVEDPSVLDLLRERAIALDVCPISNVKLRVASSPENHQIRELLAAGIACSVSTDDPISFGNTLAEEYQILSEALGFDRTQLIRVARHGFEASLTTEEWKKIHLQKLDQMARRL